MHRLFSVFSISKFNVNLTIAMPFYFEIVNCEQLQRLNKQNKK